MNLANWALWTSSKFTTGVKYQFHQGFDQIRDLEIPITLLPLLYVDYRNANILLLLIFVKFNNKIIKTIMKGGKILNRQRALGTTSYSNNEQHCYLA